MDQTAVFSTPWFQLIARSGGAYSKNAPHYSLTCADYVSVISRTVRGNLLLVQQFRPALEEVTLEFPSGHLEKDESPLQAAQRELLEETGFASSEGEILGCLRPDTGRLANRLWAVYLPDVYESGSAQNLGPTEQGLQVVEYPLKDVLAMVESGIFSHALNLASLLLALQKNVFRDSK